MDIDDGEWTESMVMAEPTSFPVAATAPPVNQDFNLAGLLAFLSENKQPALAALLGNAFRMDIEGNKVTFWYDSANANLIPMVRTPMNMTHAQPLISRYCRIPARLFFAVGTDPEGRAGQNAQENEKVTHIVMEDPNVKFLLDHLNGTIITCEPWAKEAH